MQLCQAVVWHAVQEGGQGAQRVAVRHDQNGTSAEYLRHHGVLPVGHDATQRHFQAFRRRQVGQRNAAVARVPTQLRRSPCVRGGNAAEAFAPEPDGLCTHHPGSRFLVQPLQRTVVPLVQPPVFVHGRPAAAKTVQHPPDRVNTARHHRGEDPIGQQARVPQHVTGPGPSAARLSIR